MIQNVMGALPQVLEIIFEVQRKMSNEKITRREINFPPYKFIYFSFSPSLDPSYFQTM
jgi:hypothetical protein